MRVGIAVVVDFHGVSLGFKLLLWMRARGLQWLDNGAAAIRRHSLLPGRAWGGVFFARCGAKIVDFKPPVKRGGVFFNKGMERLAGCREK